MYLKNEDWFATRTKSSKGSKATSSNMSAERVVQELLEILPRVAQQDKFNRVVARVGTTICSLKAEILALQERMKAEKALHQEKQLLLVRAAFDSDI